MGRAIGEVPVPALPSLLAAPVCLAAWRTFGYIPPLGPTHLLAGRIPMKTRVWMLCCLGLLAPLQMAGAHEPPQGVVKITLGVEGEGFERIPVVGPLLKYFVAGEECCAEQSP